MKVNVNFDKMLKELLFKHLSYKNLVCLKLKLEGKLNKDIAAEIDVKIYNTSVKGGVDSGVTWHIKRIKAALKVNTDIELALLCYERGYVTIEEEPTSAPSQEVSFPSQKPLGRKEKDTQSPAVVRHSPHPASDADPQDRD